MIAVILFFLLHSGSLQAAAAPSPGVEVDSLLQSAKCHQQAVELLKNWKVKQDWVRKPSGMDGGKIFASPTEKIGTWTIAEIYPDQSVELYRNSPESVIHASWRSSDCMPQIQPKLKKESTLSPKYAFKDIDLEKLANEKAPSLIYSWSPHMPLSIRGFGDAKKMAGKMGLTFVPVLDPQADAAAVRKVLESGKIPAGADRRADSVELSLRGMHLHYPSFLVLSHGKFSRLYPGLWVNDQVLEKTVKGLMQ